MWVTGERLYASGGTAALHPFDASGDIGTGRGGVNVRFVGEAVERIQACSLVDSGKVARGYIVGWRTKATPTFGCRRVSNCTLVRP